jgi:hypothetical protein
MGRGKTRISNPQQRLLREAQENMDDYRKRLEKERRRREARTYPAGGVTRCGRCPPTRCCDECASINKGRQMAGLIRPYGMEVDHANNAMVPLVEGKYRGARRLLNKGVNCPVVTAYLKRSGSGWMRGASMLNGQDVYVGPATRDKDAAWAFAADHAQLIKDGLEYERNC